ncbi:class I SAM-dependent methyltransferase [Kitasatospora sp. NPDC056651]|uniref:class I SAM-dependent methyltransferase n=1 Tax=Kitasatospora sp. NPDC056651 TaxID=3345892 RepID=UPI003674FDC9
MAQYDALAARLADVDKAIQFYRENLEFPSFLRALGPVRGKRVLDVGCGDGLYARMVARRGAEHVVGTDSSSEMIRLAEAAEAKQPLGIRYHVHDMATMPALGSFDLVIAVNVLHYADSRATLDGMYRQIHSHLAPGGRLLAYAGNVNCDAEAARDFGFLLDLPADPHEGDPFTITIAATPPAPVKVHYWPPATLAQVAESAGFTRFHWEESTRSPVSPDTDTDTTTLDRLVKNPPNLLFSAHRE